VDAEKGIVYDVLFLGLHSRNRADYPRQVMEEALPQYEGALSYAGHARDGVNPDPDKAFGVPRNCHVVADGIRGDYYFPPKHRLAEDLVWRAQNAPKSVGFSHDASCTWQVRDGRKVVTKIDRVYSVDYVTRPATTSGLFEDEADDLTEHTPPSLQEETKMGVEWKDITVELLSTNCPDLVSKLQGTDEHTRLTEEVKTLKAAADTTAAELATLKAEKAARLREQEIAADLTAAKFPVNDPVVYSAEFKEELAAAPDKAKRDRLIKDRLAVAKGRLTEGGLPAPLANLKEDETDNRHHNSVNASLFVAK
jgi:hypothetical protein